MFDQSEVNEVQKECDSKREELKTLGVDGPWMTEPDRVEFKHSGLDCLLSRHPSGFHWCGYVGVPSTHPLHGVDYNSEAEALKEALEKKKEQPFDIQKAGFGQLLQLLAGEVKATPEMILDVHGGITYSKACNGFICHKTESQDDLFWFGFDCAHLYDLSPGHESFRKTIPGFPQERMERDVYKDINYVTEQTKQLAEQLSAIAGLH